MKRLVLVGAADSIGVPYTKDNMTHEGFFELIEQYLSSNQEVISINCFHMSDNNDSSYIKNLISSRMTLAEIKESQNRMLEKCKYSGVYPYSELPKRFLNHYEVNDTDKAIIVQDYIKGNDTVFIYSAFVNDLLKSKQLSLFKLLRPGRVSRELKALDLNDFLNDLDNNLLGLIELNPSIKIFLVGLFVPTKISYVRNSLDSFIVRVNKAFEELVAKYDNVYLIDNSNLCTKDFNNVDFHPNRLGHQKIYENFLKIYQYDNKWC